MVIWQYIEGDTFAHGYLKEVRKVYVQKSLTALTRLKKLKTYERYGLPGYRFMIIHAKQGFEDAMESIDNIDKAIKAGQEIKDRKIDISNHE